VAGSIANPAGFCGSEEQQPRIKREKYDYSKRLGEK
jgi:hypothetical protein